MQLIIVITNIFYRIILERPEYLYIFIHVVEIVYYARSTGQIDLYNPHLMFSNEINKFNFIYTRTNKFIITKKYTR